MCVSHAQRLERYNNGSRACCKQFNISSSDSEDNAREQSDADAALSLVLYTSDHCPLCDGLREKLQACITTAQFTGGLLYGASLELRDVNLKPNWYEHYSSRVPVLCVKYDDGTEVELPRVHPRIPAHNLARHIEKYVKH